MNEETIELIKDKGDEKRYIAVLEESGLIYSAEEVNREQDDFSECDIVKCSNFEIDLKNNCIKFSILEETKFVDTIHYCISLDKLDFNDFFISLIRHLNVTRLRKVIKKVLEHIKLKEKFYEFVKNKLYDLTSEERNKLGKVLVEYDKILATKLLV